MKKVTPLLLLLLASCANTSHWKLDAITTGNKEFDAARLIYADQKNSPLRFELIRIETGIEAFLTLTKYKISPSPGESSAVLAEFLIDNEKQEEKIPLLQGGMRLRLSKETTSSLIKALQEGRKVVILVDGFEQTLDSERFSKLFEKLSGSAAFIQNPFKGPF